MAKNHSSTEDRFFSRVLKTDSCWHWTAYKNPDGYGRFGYEKNIGYAHRYSYLLHHGPIPEGYEVDHLCKVRDCVNPDHLRAIPWEENAGKGQRRHIEFCRHGHKYEAVYVGKKKARHCRVCKNIRVRDWKRQNKLKLKQRSVSL